MHDKHPDFIIIATHADPKKSDLDIFSISGGSAGGGLLLLLILVASFFIVVCLVQQKKRRTIKSRCNISTDVAYSTTERSELNDTMSCVYPDCNDYENVTTHTNADNKGSEPVPDIVYAVPNFDSEEHQFPASGTVMDKDCIATHTNAAYASSKSPLAAELAPVFDTVLPDIVGHIDIILTNT